MSQLPGTELAAAWPVIPRPNQDQIASEVGELLAALHGLDPAHGPDLVRYRLDRFGGTSGQV